MTKRLERLLITVMTYPHPSKKFDELICTAGISEKGDWIRLYPIDYRYRRQHLSFFNNSGKQVVVYCPESKGVTATQSPAKKVFETERPKEAVVEHFEPEPIADESSAGIGSNAAPTEQHFKIHYGDIGYSYERIIAPYLNGAKHVTIEDAYIRKTHQVHNFVRACEAIVKHSNVKKITLATKFDSNEELDEVKPKLEDIRQSLLDIDIEFEIKISPALHDREIRIDNGWVIKIGRGLDIYQKTNTFFDIGSNDLTLRKCLETNVDIFEADKA